MRRRLLTALVGAVVAALLAVGVVTVALVRLAAYDTTVEHLENSATTLATVIGGSIAADVHVPLLARGRMQRLSRSLGVENIGVLLLMPHPSMPPRILAELPEGLTPADLDPDVLVATGTSSGRVGEQRMGRSQPLPPMWDALPSSSSWSAAACSPLSDHPAAGSWLQRL